MTHVCKFPLPVERSDGAFLVTRKQAVMLLAMAWASGVSCCTYFVLIVIKGVAL
jgi:hypothetical protein